jgi:transposase-like protein
LEGENGILAPLLKRLLEAGVQGKLEGHLSSPEQSGNRRNRQSTKKLKTHYGSIEVATPRDRNDSFEPELLPKRQTTLSEGLDHKTIS